MKRVVRASSHVRTPWKNGGGSTIQLAISPGTAGLDDFEWRISMATVASGGPFSVFAGVDRTLCILEGAGLIVDVGALSRRLLPASEPFAFSGDDPVSATLVDGAIIDFNVMTRRGRFSHVVRRMRIHGTDTRESGARVRALFCHRNAATIHTGKQTYVLGPLDLLIDDEADGPWTVSAEVPSVVYLVELTQGTFGAASAPGGSRKGSIGMRS